MSPQPARKRAAPGRPAGGLLRPSQLPLPGEMARRIGSPSPVGGQPHHGLQRLRLSGAPAGAALPLARPSAVPARQVQDVLRGPGQPLAAPLKEEMEARLGADFSKVRVHTDAAARASATELGASAYTFGTHVVIGDGGAGKHTLAHELTHVIQQRQGPVAGTDHGNGLKVSNPSDHSEREAATNAARAMSGPILGCTTGHASPGPDSASAADRGSAIQRVISMFDLSHGPNPPEVPPVFGPLHDDCGSSVGAELYGKFGFISKGTGVGGSRPSWWPGQAGAPNVAPQTKNWFSNNMVQGHLLNDNLGGKGERQNLTPLTRQANSAHLHAAETEIKNAVLKEDKIVQYEVNPDYTPISGADLVGNTLSGADKALVAGEIDANYQGKIPLQMSPAYAVFEWNPNPPPPNTTPRWVWQHGSDWHVTNERR